MPILSGDIKLIASQVMDDVPEGGGAPTANVIQDGVSNSIFPDISELDRAGGRVNLRKLFVSVQTNDRDTYMGSNVIVAEPPADPNVSITLFTNEKTFDTRSEVASRVESYLNAGPEIDGYLYENHITGQRSIQIFQRTTAAIPPVGRTLVLRKNEGLGTEVTQYVRITRVLVEERTFTYSLNSDYQANVVTCDLSDALRYDFPGSPADRSYTKLTTATKLRDTVVADAGTYCGVTPLTQVAATGDVYTYVESVYSQLVPAAQSENPLVDQAHSSSFTNTLATTPRLVQVGGAPMSLRIKVTQETRGYNYTAILAPLPAKGSLRIVYRALGNSYSLTDDGTGTLKGNGSGTVNYLTGSVSVTLQALPDDRSAIVFYWGPNQAFTDRSGQAGFKPPSVRLDLDHTFVEAGSVVVTWTSGGVIKTATDDGAAAFTGDGTGVINYVSGELLLVPGSFPDAGAQYQIDYEWSEVVEEAKPGLAPDASGFINVTLAEEPVPGSLAISWATTQVTTVSSGASSSIATATRTSSNSTYQVQAPNKACYAWSSTASNGSSSSRSTSVSSASTTSITLLHTITDDTVGVLAGGLGAVLYSAKSFNFKAVADFQESSFNTSYENASSFESSSGINSHFNTSSSGSTGGSSNTKGGSYGSQSFKENFGSNSLIVRYKTGVAVPQVATQSYTPPEVMFELVPYTTERVVQGSVRFTWMGTTYEDFEGIIYRGRTDSDAGIASGTMDYETGIAIMTDYVVSGNPATFVLNSLWTRKGKYDPIATLAFNTELSPIKPAGLVLSVLDAAGDQIIATANTDGLILADHVYGSIDYATGLVEVQFGDFITEANLTDQDRSEWWYDIDDVMTEGTHAGKIWRPWPVLAETLRYNAIAYTYLPLDADILGLDPVRLPSDGRVPIFRAGGFAVVGHTNSVTATVSNGQTIDCARVRLSRVRVIGNDGVVINTGYSADLDAGTVTFSNVSGYSQPVTIEHRIEDMVLVSDVQITGRLKFTRQLTHTYPLGSYVSSALVAGDLKSRVSVLFDQATWNNTWSDAVTGSSASGTYNNIANPIEVTNVGAITERWAIVFTNTTAYNVIGEHVGVIAQGSTGTNLEVLNPSNGIPYFTIPATGWGIGWATGNVLRFNTVGAMTPVWAVRTVQQGPSTGTQHTFTILSRGDVDRP